MNRKSGFLLLLIFLVLLFIYINSRTGNIYEKVEVEVYRHSIIVPIIIGGKTYSFHLDTGAPTSISKALYAELGLSATDSSPAMDYYGNRRWVHNSVLPEIQIGNTAFSDVAVGIVNPIQSFFYCDKTIDGYLGSDFFRDKMLMMNLREKEIVITNNRSKLPIRRQDAIKLELRGDQLTPMLVVEFPPKIREWVLFDTGSSNNFYHPTIHDFNKMFKDGFIAPENILDTLYDNKGGGIFGSQTDSVSFLIHYDTLKIGKTNFTNIRTSTFGGGIGSNIGAPLLKKGIVIVDWKYRHLYFNPYPHQSMDFKPKAGFDLHYQGSKFYATSTDPKSLSYSSGVRDGFVLTHLNGIQMGSLTDCGLLNFDWRDEWSRPEVTAKLEFEGQEYCINEYKNPIYQSNF